jgi:CheY-like chemotaxis protein
MATRCLRVLMAEKRLSEVGIILRSICADVGWALELIFAETREELEKRLETHHPDLALLDLTVLQPDAPVYLHGLHLKYNRIPLIVFGVAAGKACLEECLSSGARDYLLEGFMDDRTVARVLRAAMAATEKNEFWNRKGSNAEETCKCALLATGPEGAAHQSIRLIVQEKQEEFVRVLKRNVRASDRIVPRWCGEIELVLSNANEDCLGTVLRRLRTQMSASEAQLSPDAPFRVTVCIEAGVEISHPLMNVQWERATGNGAGEFLREIEERP